MGCATNFKSATSSIASAQDAFNGVVSILIHRIARQKTRMRKHVDRSAPKLMIVLSLIWGMQQVALKAIAADVSPSLQVGLRSAVGALLVWLYPHRIARDQWLPGLASGPGAVVTVLYALEFLFVSTGLQWTSAAHMAVFVYTAPMFAAIGLHLTIPAERLNLSNGLGLGWHL